MRSFTEYKRQPKNMSDIDWFWMRVNKTKTCWYWTRSCNNRWRKKTLTAHRVAYAISGFKLPKGKELDHLCKQRNCVNPAHLEPVTHKENILRGSSPSALHAKKTKCKYGHPYELQIRSSGKKQRVCRICARIYAENYRGKK